MYRASILLSLLAGIYLDVYLLPMLDLFNFYPDCTLAVVVSLGILLGSARGAFVGGLAGMLIDLFVGRSIGLYALCYLLTGTLAGRFYKKFYADNLFVPVAIAVCCALAKEILFAAALRFAGGSFALGSTLLFQIIPAAALTGAACIPIHALLKPMLQRQVKKRYERSAGGMRS